MKTQNLKKKIQLENKDLKQQLLEAEEEVFKLHSLNLQMQEGWCFSLFQRSDSKSYVLHRAEVERCK